MPNIDSGSYFLTAFFPIRHFPAGDTPYVEYTTADNQVMRLLPFQDLRHTLSVMRTAHQGPATFWDGEKNGVKIRSNVPCQFAGNLRTHFTRFFVIDNAVYNGRNPSNVISDTIINIAQTKLKNVPVINRFIGKPSSLLDAQPVDQLSHPYLAWFTDIDAPNGTEEDLDTYLEELWGQMKDKLTEIFQHCHGFDKENMDAAKFVKFVRKGQIETVMPFHDYWNEPPALGTFLQKGHSMATKTVGLAGAIATIVTFFGLVIHFFNWLFFNAGGTSWWLVFFLISLLITIYVVYRDIMNFGQLPFAKAPKSSLPWVLKSLYLQQKLVDFAGQNQSGDAEKLHENFGKFLSEHQPKNEFEPTQPAGTICK